MAPKKGKKDKEQKDARDPEVREALLSTKNFLKPERETALRSRMPLNPPEHRRSALQLNENTFEAAVAPSVNLSPAMAELLNKRRAEHFLWSCGCLGSGFKMYPCSVFSRPVAA